MAEKKKIIALTTDPYDNIYGYALIFMKLFDYIQNNNKNITLIANSEITELISVFILTIKFKKVYCLIQDLQLRDQLLKTKIIYQLRLFLIYRIKNVIFSNNYTMGQLNNSINKFYIGNPIF